MFNVDVFIFMKAGGVLVSFCLSGGCYQSPKCDVHYVTLRGVLCASVGSDDMPYDDDDYDL